MGSIRKQNGSKKEQREEKNLITLLKLLLTFSNFSSNLILSEIWILKKTTNIFILDINCDF